MSDEEFDDAEGPMPLRTKIVAGVVVTVVLLGAVLLIMRMGSPAIGASRTAPGGHYPLPCAVCHTITTETPAIGAP
jgi:hypothetical protein